MLSKKIIDKLENLSPVMFAESYDNPGLLCGRMNKQVKTVLVTVDVTDEVVDQAINEKVDMIVAHHPLIFKGLKAVTDQDFIGRRIYKLIKNDICLYAMHTNFDVTCMADEAADILDLSNRSVMVPTFEDSICKEGIGRVGMVSNTITLKQMANRVKECFHLDKVRVYGNLDMKIDIAAVCPGSGGDFGDYAIKNGAQVLITGDVKHHEAIDNVAKGLAVIDASHFGLEKIFVDFMTDYIFNEIGDLKVIRSIQNSPYTLI